MLFFEVSSDIVIIADAVLSIFDILSAALAAAILYIIVVGGALRRDEDLSIQYGLTVRVGSFFIAVLVCIIATHLLIQRRYLLAAEICFISSGLICLTVYWLGIRSVNRSDDMRIPYAMMVWGALWILSSGSLMLIWIGRGRLALGDGLKLNLEIIAQTASLLISATGIVFTYVMKTDQANRTARQQIYQTLELQSVQLFRFESEHEKLVAKLWYAKSPPKAPADRYQLKQYVCQMLNLFEMAYRFRAQQIIAPEVFGSWVIWIWELCCNPVFKKLWHDKSDDLPLNYVADFRAAVGLGIEISERTDLSAIEQRDLYFGKLGKILGCKEIKKWLASGTAGRF